MITQPLKIYRPRSGLLPFFKKSEVFTRARAIIFMPKIVNIKEFRKNMSFYIKSLDGYSIVANEVSKQGTFIVVEPQVMVGLLIEAGQPGVADEITQGLSAIRLKVGSRIERIKSIR